jgi:hypothetical protein
VGHGWPANRAPLVQLPWIDGSLSAVLTAVTRAHRVQPAGLSVELILVIRNDPIVPGWGGEY